MKICTDFTVTWCFQASDGLWLVLFGCWIGLSTGLLGVLYGGRDVSRPYGNNNMDVVGHDDMVQDGAIWTVVSDFIQTFFCDFAQR